MTTLRFAKDAPALLRGADTLLVLASRAAFQNARFAKGLPVGLRAAVKAAAAGVAPGDGGATRATLVDGKPGRLIVGVLPDAVSRHNCPARAEAVRTVTRAAGIAGERAAAVLCVLDRAEHQVPVVNAVGRALPLFSRKSGQKRSRTVRLAAVTRSGEPVTIDKTTQVTVDAARQAARLVDTPPTEMHPGAMAKEARAMLRGVDHVRVTELAGAKLLDAGLGGVWGVGRCAVESPRLLVATYAPPRASGAPVALVGKGVTYDTGGLHLKGRGGMEGMKGDMGGSAATLGAFRVLAERGVRRKLYLVLALAENAIGPQAYKPDDILTMHSGKTVEINNTDAEGRLLLADGVSWAVRKLGAEIVLDAATLTGAQLVATGLVHAAVVSNDAALEQLMGDAGRASGDLVHPLPFAPELYKKEFRSPIADMRNSVKNRGNAQSSCAAQFIWWHIEDTDARWVHVDLAGPAWREDRGTGFGVALLAEAVRRLK
ncbi:MAG: leucyl aminopeptidase family protein [Planctomycetota bacterium]